MSHSHLVASAPSETLADSSAAKTSPCMRLEPLTSGGCHCRPSCEDLQAPSSRTRHRAEEGSPEGLPSGGTG
eukprot:538960-Alexandrium_andersonii.AAC.1